ncbi:MAG: hypothetical protein CO035_02110, partial [Candidatus Omnitrophica bacterium CG_4_9_14_0_2_um_filter_42_8]
GEEGTLPVPGVGRPDETRMEEFTPDNLRAFYLEAFSDLLDEGLTASGSEVTGNPEDLVIGSLEALMTQVKAQAPPLADLILAIRNGTMKLSWITDPSIDERILAYFSSENKTIYVRKINLSGVSEEVRALYGLVILEEAFHSELSGLTGGKIETIAAEEILTKIRVVDFFGIETFINLLAGLNFSNLTGFTKELVAAIKKQWNDVVDFIKSGTLPVKVINDIRAQFVSIIGQLKGTKFESAGDRLSKMIAGKQLRTMFETPIFDRNNSKKPVGVEYTLVYEDNTSETIIDSYRYDNDSNSAPSSITGRILIAKGEGYAIFTDKFLTIGFKDGNFDWENAVFADATNESADLILSTSTAGDKFLFSSDTGEITQLYNFKGETLSQLSGYLTELRKEID